MREFLSRAAVALVMSVSALGVACSDTAEPPVEQGSGLSTGSTCPSNETLTYENFGMAFFSNYCTRCHSDNTPDGLRHGAPRGYNWDDIDAVRLHAAEIDRMAAAGPDATNERMPEGDESVPRPTLEERRDLGEWLACGAP